MCVGFLDVVRLLVRNRLLGFIRLARLSADLKVSSIFIGVLSLACFLVVFSSVRLTASRIILGRFGPTYG